jgi:sugar lactone lactonase YvrE
VGTNGNIATVAGNGSNSYSGDGGPATNASLSYPAGVAVDAFGNMFIADTGNNRIRQVGTNGMILTVAGDGTNGYFGDGSLATNASLSHPAGVAVDGSGNLFIADSGNKRVRKVETNGFITTVAGSGAAGFFGDGGPAINAFMESPAAVAVDPGGRLLIADSGNHRIRVVDLNGFIATLAGNGVYGFAGDGGPPVNAALSDVYGLAVDPFGNVFIADTGNNRVRELFNYQGPALGWHNVSAANAGGYNAVVISPYGIATSAVVALTVVGPPLGVSRKGNELILNWPGAWELETASNLNGPWSNEPAATSPFTNQIGPQGAGFFRLH